MVETRKVSCITAAYVVWYVIYHYLDAGKMGPLNQKLKLVHPFIFIVSKIWIDIIPINDSIRATRAALCKWGSAFVSRNASEP